MHNMIGIFEQTSEGSLVAKCNPSMSKYQYIHDEQRMEKQIMELKNDARWQKHEGGGFSFMFASSSNHQLCLFTYLFARMTWYSLSFWDMVIFRML